MTKKKTKTKAKTKNLPAKTKPYRNEQEQQREESAFAMIARACENKDIDVDKLKEMIALQIATQEHQAKLDYAAALSRFAAIKQPIAHNRTGTTAGKTSFSYTDYPTMVTAVTPWLMECGLSFSHVQEPPVIEGGKVILVMVTCIIKHVGGHSERFPFPAVLDDKLRDKISPSQLLQLAATYAKRQTLAMGLGLATMEDTHDDDSQAPEDTINDEQAANIEALIDEVGAKKPAFLKMLKVDILTDLPVSKYSGAIKRLEDKRKSK